MNLYKYLTEAKDGKFDLDNRNPEEKKKDAEELYKSVVEKIIKNIPKDLKQDMREVSTRDEKLGMAERMIEASADKLELSKDEEDVIQTKWTKICNEILKKF